MGSTFTKGNWRWITGGFEKAYCILGFDGVKPVTLYWSFGLLAVQVKRVEATLQGGVAGGTKGMKLYIFMEN